MGALAICGTFAVSAMAQDPPERPPQQPRAAAKAPESIDNAQELVAKLQMLNQEEIEAGKVAMENASSAEVKDYGHKLMTDHQKKQDMVEQFAKSKQFEWKDTVELPAESKEKVQKLRGLKGAAFDSAFLREMEAGHQKAIDMVSKASESLKDAEARKLATDFLPGLKEHLEIAKKLQKKPTD
jgi:putative membrane protein